MIDGFDIQLEKKPSEEALRAALSGAFGFFDDEVNLQYLDRYDLKAPKRKLFCLVTEGDGGDAGFPVLLTLSSLELNLDETKVKIASKISDALGIACLISSGHPHDDDTRLLIHGFEKPKLVIICEDHDELGGQINSYLREA